MADLSNSKMDRTSSFGAMIKIAIVPVVIVIGLLIASPNYQKPDLNSGQPLGHPLGGDYLQEYIGGQLILDASTRKDLYNASAFESAQHDRTRLGFAWEENQFFPAVYPPFWYAAVSPVSKLPYLTAARFWLVLMTAFLVAAIWILNRYASVPIPISIVMCLSTPVIQNLSAGQKGTLLLLILSASYVLLKKRHEGLSGLVFALIAFKPHLAIVIGLWMLTNRKWRWCAGAFSGVAVLIAVSFVISPNLIGDYVNVVSGFGNYVQSGGYNLNESFSCWSFWQQLVNHSTLAKVLTVITSVSVLGVSLWIFRQHSSPAPRSCTIDRSFAAMVVVTMITAPHLYTYDLTMLLLPIGLLTRIALTPDTTGSHAGPKDYSVWLPVGLLMLVMFASGAITRFAASTGFQAGVLLLLVTWIAIMRPWIVAPQHAS